VLKDAEAERVMRPSFPEIDMEALVAQTTSKGRRDRRIHNLTILIRDLFRYALMLSLG
jgi:hypothetical protein